MIRQAVILCGGLGTRLGELTAERPKPLLPIDGDPFLDVLLFELGCHGVRRILLLAGFAASRILDYAAATPVKKRFGLEIEISVEPQRAGTGGAVWQPATVSMKASFY
jgi:NDP-sugar pyrophosphorylase family protein